MSVSNSRDDALLRAGTGRNAQPKPGAGNQILGPPKVIFSSSAKNGSQGHSEPAVATICYRSRRFWLVLVIGVPAAEIAEAIVPIAATAVQAAAVNPQKTSMTFSKSRDRVDSAYFLPQPPYENNNLTLF